MWVPGRSARMFPERGQARMQGLPRSVLVGDLVDQQDSAVAEAAEFFSHFVVEAFQIADHGVAADGFDVGSVENERLAVVGHFFRQNRRNLGNMPDRRADDRIAALPQIEDGALFPRTGEDHPEQPVLLLARFRQIHDHVERLRRRPGRKHQPELLLHLGFGDFTADIGAAAVVPVEEVLIDQHSDRLAQRHIADPDLFGQFALRGQGGAARKVAVPDLLQQPVTGLFHFGFTRLFHPGSPEWRTLLFAKYYSKVL